MLNNPELKLSKFLLSIPVLCGLNSYAIAAPELENIRFVSENIIQINTNETLKKLPDSFILNDTNPSKIIFDFADVDFKKELKQKLSATTKNLRIVKDDNTNKTRLVITLKDNEKVNYKTELYRNGIQITLSPITEHNKNFDVKTTNQNQIQSQNISPANNNANVNNETNSTTEISQFDHIIYSKTNNVINFNFLRNNVALVNSTKDQASDSLIITLLNTTLSKKAKNLLAKNIVSYNKNNSFNLKFAEDKTNNTLKFTIKHNKKNAKNKSKNKNKTFVDWDYDLLHSDEMITLKLIENYEENNADNSKKNNENLVDKNANLNDSKKFCEQMQSVNQSAGNILLTNLKANDINDFILSDKCQGKKLKNLDNINNNVILIGNTSENLLDNLTKQHNTEAADIPTISNDFLQQNNSANDNVKTLNVSSDDSIPLMLNLLVLQKNSNGELVKMPKTTTKHDYKNSEKTDLNNTIVNFKNAKLSLEVIPKMVSKNKTNLALILRQNSAANSSAGNLNDTQIFTETNAYVDNNGTLSVAVLSNDKQKVLILIQPKINNDKL